MAPGHLEIREPWHLRRRERLVLGGLVSAAIVSDVVRETTIVLLLSPVMVAYVADQVRSRVVVTDDELIIVRALWKRRAAQSRVRAVRLSSQWLARLLVDDSNLGIQLPSGGPGLVQELADALDVPIEDVG